MKASHWATCLISAALFCGGVSAVAGSTQPDSAAIQLKSQTHCPVMGGKIDSAAFTDIQGQRVYHCCPMCTKKLTADPDTYFKKAATQGIVYQNIQTTCPVSGKPIDKKFESYCEGRRVYFADAASKAKFDASPIEYLTKMLAPAASEDAKKDK